MGDDKPEQSLLSTAVESVRILQEEVVLDLLSVLALQPTARANLVILREEAAACVQAEGSRELWHCLVKWL